MSRGVLQTLWDVFRCRGMISNARNAWGRLEPCWAAPGSMSASPQRQKSVTLLTEDLRPNAVCVRWTRVDFFLMTLSIESINRFSNNSEILYPYPVIYTQVYKHSSISQICVWSPFYYLINLYRIGATSLRPTHESYNL